MPTLFRSEATRALKVCPDASLAVDAAPLDLARLATEHGPYESDPCLRTLFPRTFWFLGPGEASNNHSARAEYLRTSVCGDVLETCNLGVVWVSATWRIPSCLKLVGPPCLYTGTLISYPPTQGGFHGMGLGYRCVPQ